MDKDLGREPMPIGEKNIAYKDSSGYRARGVVVLDEDGGQQSDPTKGYGISNIDDDSEPQYYGSERSDGAWYILRLTTVAGDQVAEYLKGASDLAASWGTRVANSYDTFANTF